MKDMGPYGGSRLSLHVSHREEHVVSSSGGQGPHLSYARVLNPQHGEFFLPHGGVAGACRHPIESAAMEPAKWRVEP